MIGALVLPTRIAPARSIRSEYGQYASMTWSRSVRIPPKVDGQPGLKSNRSFIAVGTPCRGPRVAPEVTADSAARALSMAWPESGNTKAVRLGFPCAIALVAEVIGSHREGSALSM